MRNRSHNQVLPFPTEGVRIQHVFFILALVVAGLMIGCSSVKPALRAMERVAISHVPNPDKAYLIINASFLPKGQPQPTWVGLSQKFSFEHLVTTKNVFEVRPTISRVSIVYFTERPGPKKIDPGPKNIYVGLNTPIVWLNAGTIYFYGRVEIDSTGRRTLIRTVRDLDLYRRACEQVPELFEQFEVIPIGPITRGGGVLPKCGELLSDPDADSMKNPD